MYVVSKNSRTRVALACNAASGITIPSSRNLIIAGASSLLISTTACFANLATPVNVCLRTISSALFNAIAVPYVLTTSGATFTPFSTPVCKTRRIFNKSASPKIPLRPRGVIQSRIPGALANALERRPVNAFPPTPVNFPEPI